MHPPTDFSTVPLTGLSYFTSLAPLACSSLYPLHINPSLHSRISLLLPSLLFSPTPPLFQAYRLRTPSFYSYHMNPLLYILFLLLSLLSLINTISYIVQPLLFLHLVPILITYCYPIPFLSTDPHHTHISPPSFASYPYVAPHPLLHSPLSLYPDHSTPHSSFRKPNLIN